jgi:hypothetical protein
VGGEDVLDTLEKLQIKSGTERPIKPVKITEVVMYACLLQSMLLRLSHVFYTDIRILSKTTKSGWPESSRKRLRPKMEHPLAKRSKTMALIGSVSKLEVAHNHPALVMGRVEWVNISN